MKWLLLLAVVAVVAGGVAVAAAERVARGEVRYRGIVRPAWFVATTLALVAAVIAAHAMGFFTVPLVAIAFVVAAVSLRATLAVRRRRRDRLERRAAVVHGADQPSVPIGVSRQDQR